MWGQSNFLSHERRLTGPTRMKYNETEEADKSVSMIYDGRAAMAPFERTRPMTPGEAFRSNPNAHTNKKEEHHLSIVLIWSE